ncbi:pyridoxal phosphate-dependent transferase [Mycena albidolilacea]|uniref:Pyridoxal phosphate-dependent transferase n=1 Tax=Mycena albidolilacea TaxID=1033008 RepID=A0AAD7F1Q4_9AGAR|nr:pyridoxal phosphate-dependent transferase [Mycena albidolilacea]
MTARGIVSWRDKIPPQFGRAMLEYFPFDPGYTNLNHGSYGSLPLPVMEACRVLDSEAESSPDRWMKFTYTPRLINVRQRIAALIGAKTDECVLVPNASHAISTVLRNIEWQKDDVIVAFKTTYNSVERTAQYISDTTPHPAVSTVALTFPASSAKVLAQFRDHLRRLPRKDGQKIVAIIDSIASLPALLLPWKEMVQICKEESVLSLIDAAHSIGQEINLDLNKADPDFWTSNCHKWLYAKRSCAVLYVPFRNQHIIKSTFPTSQEYISPSKRNGPNFVEQFEWTATIDFVPYFSVVTALDFRQWLGGEEKINAYCRRIALQGTKRLAQILGTSATALDPSGEMTLNMTNVQLPLPPSLGPASVVSGKLKKKLLLERNIFATVFFLEGMGWWTRCSAQVWTEVGDFEKLGKALVEVCSEIVKEMQVDEAKLKSKL